MRFPLESGCKGTDFFDICKFYFNLFEIFFSFYSQTLKYQRLAASFFYFFSILFLSPLLICNKSSFTSQNYSKPTSVHNHAPGHPPLSTYRFTLINHSALMHQLFTTCKRRQSATLTFISKQPTIRNHTWHSGKNIAVPKLSFENGLTQTQNKTRQNFYVCTLTNPYRTRTPSCYIRILTKRMYDICILNILFSA